jgi:hypothetical protein
MENCYHIGYYVTVKFEVSNMKMPNKKEKAPEMRNLTHLKTQNM